MRCSGFPQSLLSVTVLYSSSDLSKATQSACQQRSLLRANLCQYFCDQNGAATQGRCEGDLTIVVLSVAPSTTFLAIHTFYLTLYDLFL